MINEVVKNTKTSQPQASYFSTQGQHNILL
jgi:hypothetical protein